MGSAAPDRLVKIATFMSGVEAHIARNELEAAGIPAQVTDEIAVSTIWHVGTALGGVKLYVAADQEDKARQVLADSSAAGYIAETGDDTPEEKEPAADSPLARKAEVAARAWRAAVIGCFLCPPLLNIYSMGLIFTHPDIMHEADDAVRRRVFGAVAINTIVLCAAGYLWSQVWWMSR